MYLMAKCKNSFIIHRFFELVPSHVFLLSDIKEADLKL